MGTLKMTILLAILLLGCNTKPTNNSIISANLKLNPITDSLFTMFSERHKEARTFAIFFDKKDEKDFQVTMVSSNQANGICSKKTAAFWFYTENHIPVYLYTGMEDFLTINASLQDTKETKKNESINELNGLAYISAKDTVYVVDSILPPTFFQGTLNPTVTFKPPLIPAKRGKN